MIPEEENKKVKSIKLKLRKTISIKPTKPFAFDPTFYKPDHFVTGDTYWEPGIRWQTWNWQNRLLGVKFINKGTTDNPQISVEIFSQKTLPQNLLDLFIEEIKYRYNLELDLSEFYKQFRNDKLLVPIIRKLRGMRPGNPLSLYEYLIVGIVLQNASARRSIQMFRALLEKYGTQLEFDNKRLWCFWAQGKLKKVSGEELRILKVGYRAKSIKKIDDYFEQGLVNEQELREKDRETQRKELLKLYGIGPATAWYLLFDVFHHWDFFNHISPWEQKIYSKLFFNREPLRPVPVKKLLKHFEKYGKYKQLAVHYVWEDVFWRRRKENIPWLERELRL